MYALGLSCIDCGRRYPLKPLYNCSACGGILDVTYDYERMRNDWAAKAITVDDPLQLLPVGFRTKKLWRPSAGWRLMRVYLSNLREQSPSPA